MGSIWGPKGAIGERLYGVCEVYGVGLRLHFNPLKVGLHFNPLKVGLHFNPLKVGLHFSPLKVGLHFNPLKVGLHLYRGYEGNT